MKHVLSILILLVASRCFAQPGARMIWDVPGGRDGLQAQSAQVDQAPHCRVTASDGSVGSGTLFARGERSGYVTTNWHVVSGGQQITVNFPNGLQCVACIAAVDKAHDIAVLQITPRPDFAGVALSDGKTPRTITVCGYGGNGQFRAVSGTIEKREQAQGAQYQHYVANVSVRPGDSGGAVLDENGKFAGVLWGCRDGQVRFFTGVPFYKVIEDVLPGFASAQLTQCGGGVCYGPNCGPGAYPSRPPLRPVQPTTPQMVKGDTGPAGPAGPQGPQGETGPQGPPGAGSSCTCAPKWEAFEKWKAEQKPGCDCGPKWAEINARITGIELKLQHQQPQQPKPSTVNFVNGEGKVIASVVVTPGETSNVQLPPINFRVLDQRGPAFSTEYQPASLGSFVTLPFGPKP